MGCLYILYVYIYIYIYMNVHKYIYNTSIYICVYTHDKHNRDQQEGIRFTNCNILCSKSADLHFKKHRSTIDALDLLQIWFKKNPLIFLNGDSMVVLIGGWTNPFEKYARQSWDPFPQELRDENKKCLFNHHLLVVILWVILLFHIGQTPSKTNHYSSVASKRKKKSLGVSLNRNGRIHRVPHLFNLARDLGGPAVWIPKKYGFSKWVVNPIGVKFTMGKNCLK